MIRLTDVAKTYGSGPGAVQAVRGVSMQIPAGSFAVLLGASGSGKSTLLSLMSGLEMPSAGTVEAAGKCISTLSDRERTLFRRRHVGFVFQQYYLLPELTVCANVRMGADLAANRNYESIIQAVGLDEQRQQAANTLSGGQQQRVSIARAVAKKPQLLFLDEPTGALDEETGREILRYLSRLHRQEKFTMVMVTHNESIAELADCVYRLGSGRLTGVETRWEWQCGSMED
ncbi:MAG: ABC transporter ATP-binding protein [Clostridia bacterium]|nr:ABC transporter ATP-binding protein [Clostridia bacterium]